MTVGKRPSTVRKGPLASARVLELGSTVAGPFCGRLLADFGAEVIKVEPPEGDPVRSMGKHFQGHSLYAASILRNKSLVAIDLRTAEGRQLARRLALECDVVVENFRPGTLERWGLGYEDLSALRPDLVMVRISGFGQTGPYRSRPGYGVIGEAVSGLRHVTGDPDRPPARAAVSLTDYVAGIYGALGAAMALLHARDTGRGQVVDCSLYESAFSFMEPHVPAYDKVGFVANREGSRLPGSNPNNLYATRDGKHVHITAMADAVFARLAQAMESPNLAMDPRFSDAFAREANHEMLDRTIGEWTMRHDLADVERVLGNADVPATRVYKMDDIFADAHYRARDMLVAAPHVDLGTVAVPGIVPKLSLTPGAVRHAGRKCGADTRRVLGTLLALSQDVLEDLEVRGVIGGHEVRAGANS